MKQSRRSLLVVLVCISLAGMTACADDEANSNTASSTQEPTTTSPDREEPAEISVRGVEVAKLNEPIMMLPRPGDDRVWVAERAGTIRRVEVAASGDLSPDGDPVLDLTAQTTTEAERGLLGLAFSVDGAVMYVSYTDLDGNSVIASYDLDATSVDEASRTVLLEQVQPFANHNGGNLVTTPDGTLWFGLGDGGAGDDPENRAQNPTEPLGKLLEVDTSGGGAHKIVAIGLRNPWRFSFDEDGSIWIADVGQNAIEEINHVAAGDLEGANFGWSGYEGNEPYMDGPGRRPADPTMPIFTYTHDDGNCSITGGFTYAGPYAPLRGAYLFADFCAGRVRAVTVDPDGRVSGAIDLGIDVDQPISFGTDGEANAYVLSAGGSVVRLEAAP